MFVGAVPREAVEQIVRVVPFDEWGTVWVGCSGSFRFDREVKRRHGVTVVSNDVSLLTCSLGRLLLGEDHALAFTGRLAFIEDHVETFRDRVAAILVALEMARYKGENEHAKHHFAHYQANFGAFLDRARERLDHFVEETEIDGFEAGDFREQVARAVDIGGGVASFPPTYKGGYERLYKFVDENTEWAAPSYGVWDPADLEPWIDELDTAGVRYCVIADHLLERHEPVTVYRTATHKPVYAYASRSGSSVRRDSHVSQPFRYVPVDGMKLTARSTVEIKMVEGKHMNFLKDKYLARGIAHVSGMLNFLVFIDGMLVGGFIYTRSKFGDTETVYLLSDFSISRERRLSKLVALLATSKTCVAEAERRWLTRISGVFTTAFTDKPVSMKYRGAFELASRKPGMLNYRSDVRDGTPQDIYRDWFRRHARGA